MRRPTSKLAGSHSVQHESLISCSEIRASSGVNFPAFTFLSNPLFPAACAHDLTLVLPITSSSGCPPYYSSSFYFLFFFWKAFVMVLIPCSDGCFYVENKRTCEQSAGYDPPRAMDQ
ncbi:hypothetical protein BO70DRAFT_182801 [Aspergillus heteromorphus CBS 117.55]|uniref:Uncharacterized protein n=1 Tax=Aspergillus heteromorphus CBS 117.55 TaxID=1448321 RepID=A0A317WT64_9EURO|nr:uncharacterized protein BO70DRAFT_182801 [Aspergillus heteromorphus CBS 117.55]PWY88482.1 hypothetical protein BO70DRAFT_182801 [Aspergillus heteromorphus CBS 117.55]